MPSLHWRSGDIFILRFGSAKNRAKANSSVSGVTPDESIRQVLSQGIRDRYGYCPYFYSPESDTVRQALTETGTANGTILFVPLDDYGRVALALTDVPLHPYNVVVAGELLDLLRQSLKEIPARRRLPEKGPCRLLLTLQRDVSIGERKNEPDLITRPKDHTTE